MKLQNNLRKIGSGQDEAKIKIAGRRSGKIAPTLDNAEILLNTMRQLRGGRGICPRGVYRFKTFEEADEWMLKMIARSSLEYLLAKQKETAIVANSKQEGEIHGLIRRFFQTIRRLFQRPEKG
jgi:hypothetical protein